MNLRNATLCAMFGIAYLFVMRLAGTACPAAFRVLAVTRIAAAVSVLAALTLVCFYGFFYRKYAREEQPLKQAAVWAIIGSCALLVVHLKALLTTFNVPFPRDAARYVDVILPWVSAVLIMSFFIVFYRETSPTMQPHLKKAILAAIIGSSAQAAVLTFVSFNYILSSRILLTAGLARAMWFILIPITVIGFAAVFYFFLAFYRIQCAGEPDLN